MGREREVEPGGVGCPGSTKGGAAEESRSEGGCEGARGAEREVW